MTTRTVPGAAYWASYFINGDASGLEDREIKLADAWAKRELADGEDIVDVGEPYFSWSYGWHTGETVSGGDLADYTLFNMKD